MGEIVFESMEWLWDADVGEGLPGKVEVSGDIFADDGLGVVASHVVPFDPVPVKVVEDGQAGLLALSAVGLGPARTAKEREHISFKRDTRANIQ